MNPRNDRDLAHRLILRAAHRTPPALSARLAEEWLADLASRSGRPSRLRLAIGCCWATTVITREFRVPQLAASAAAAGHKPLLAVPRIDMPLISRRTVVLLAIGGLHVLLIYVFALGFTQHAVVPVASITHGIVIEEPHPQVPPPKLTINPVLSARPIIPEDPGVIENFNLKTDDDPGSPGTGGTVTTPPERPVPQVVRVLGGPGRGFPDTDDYYPSVSRRNSESGVANVQVCVDAQGRLTTDPVLARSSGTRRLDDAALNLAKAGSGHYRPTTEDGQPVSSCYPYRIRFALRN